ncbi:MAG: IS256 family transposase [Spirochaetaceae bacterium]|nr:IS256 family transposase [Spirochaetaceae bacterium]
MAILQLIAEKEKSLCFDFLEEKIREGSRKLIESIYADEVNQFLEKMASIVDGKGNKLVVRNGYHKSRVVQTACGNVEVKLPRVDDRKATEKFVSKILPPFARKTPTVETLIAALYLAGVSSNKFQGALSSVFGEDSKGFSSASIIRLTKEWQKEFEQWKRRELRGKEYVYVWADGIYVKSRLDGEKTCLLVMIGVGIDGKKELIAMESGIRESTQSWREVLLDLKFRGLTKAPKLAICDGALGFQNAVDEIWGQMKIQRCWFHKTANILDKMPKCVQKKATQMIRDMHMADTRENALEAYDKFIQTFAVKYEKAAENLKKDKDDLFRFYDYPAEHWIHIRTTNPIESTFATIRLRHKSTKGNGTAKATEAMAFKLCQQAEKSWRRLKGFEKLDLVAKDIKFENGVLKEVA